MQGWIVEFSPLKLRLEWQEPFSHHNHPVFYYTLYTRDGAIANTTDTNISISLGHDAELSNNCSNSSIGVAAVNDVGESELSPVVSMQRGSFEFVFHLLTHFLADVSDKRFVIDGNLFSQNEFIVLTLNLKVNKILLCAITDWTSYYCHVFTVQFPKLCVRQEMRYTVELVEERTGTLVYQES